MEQYNPKSTPKSTPATPIHQPRRAEQLSALSPAATLSAAAGQAEKAGV